MALKYVAVQSGGYDVTDPVSVRAATRPSTWPHMDLPDDLELDTLLLLFDATGDYCLPQFSVTYSGNIECKAHLYNNTTLYRTDDITVAGSGSANFIQYDNDGNFNYILIEVKGEAITGFGLMYGSGLKYNNQSGYTTASSDVLEIICNLDTFNGVNGDNLYKLKYLTLRSLHVTGTISNSITSYDRGLVAILEMPALASGNDTFDRCSSLQSLPPLSINGTSLYGFVEYCNSLTYMPTINNTSQVTSCSSMFSYCEALTEVSLFDTSSVANMSYMFYNCYALKKIPQFNTANVTNMNNMFYECNNLTSIPQLDTSDVTDMSGMFYDCYNLTSIPELNTSSVTSMSSMFSGCYSLITINGTVIRKSTSLSNSVLLPHDELVEIIGNLPDLTGLTAQTLTLGVTLRNKLSADEIAVATNKNWTVN